MAEENELNDAVDRLDVYFNVAANEYRIEDHDNPEWKQVIEDVLLVTNYMQHRPPVHPSPFSKPNTDAHSGMALPNQTPESVRQSR